MINAIGRMLSVPTVKVSVGSNPNHAPHHKYGAISINIFIYLPFCVRIGIEVGGKTSIPWMFYMSILF